MRTELKYGLIFGIAVMAYVMVEHFMGFNTVRHDIGEYTRLGSIIIPVLALFFGIREKRNKDFGGHMTLVQGVKTGVLIAFVQTTLTTLFFFLYAEIINPDFLNTVIEYQRTKMAQAGVLENEIRTAINQIRTMYSIPLQPVFQMIIGLLYGTVFSAIFSLFLRKEPAVERA